MVPKIPHILSPRNLIALFSMAMVFSVQANVATAGCGDYLHVKGRAPEPMSTIHSGSTDTNVKTRSQVSDDERVFPRHQPADSPCRHGNCRNGQPQIPPLAASATFSVVDDFGVSNCGIETTGANSGQRLNLSNARVPNRLFVAIDRPPG